MMQFFVCIVDADTRGARVQVPPGALGMGPGGLFCKKNPKYKKMRLKYIKIALKSDFCNN